MRRPRISLLVLLTVMAAACEADPFEDVPGSTTSYEMDRDHRCANEVDAIRSEENRSGGPLPVDMDGDGAEEDGYIVIDDQGEAGCRSFLVLDGGHVIYSVPIDPSGSPRALLIPTLNSAADVNNRSGSEVVVNIEMGASTQFVKVFTLTDEGLEQMNIQGRGPGPFAQELGQDHLFPFGGSVGHLEAVDCTEEGYVVMSAALPIGDSADSYEVERRFFAPEGTELVLEKDLTEEVTVEGLKIDDFPEFGGSPFLSCD